MSTQLEQQGIVLFSGYDAANLEPRPDLVVIGNALSRGNPEVEAALNLGLAYTSGPRWLYEAVLKDRWVLAVAGTHGKTTTTSMLAWILESAGVNPGFLIGGIPLNFGISARLGQSPYFVIEADEYDTAFFDKRSKFLHYLPRTVILNNLEYDHADIFPDLSSIQKQFHHLVRTVPGNGLIILPSNDLNLAETLRMGCWTRQETTSLKSEGNSYWQARLLRADGGEFEVCKGGGMRGTVTWGLTGLHNVRNGLAAIAAACHAGVEPEKACAALSHFKNVKRRLEVRAIVNGVTLYDDFAHHPTAIATTLEGLRANVGTGRIIAVLEPRSNTMKLGVHANTLAGSLQVADIAIIYQPPGQDWEIRYADGIQTIPTLDAIIDKLSEEVRPGDHVVFMSNGSFGGIHGKVEEALRKLG
jgi:UDP-N-acetylmuramate: L-alanyl-gamma-D-glutamyl-meso-diaminopimelate ligase